MYTFVKVNFLLNSVFVFILQIINISHHFPFFQAALVYEATAICTYCAGQKTPFTKHVRIEGIGNNNNDDDDDDDDDDN